MLTTAEQVLRLLREELLIDVDSPQQDLIASGLLDSLGLAQLLAAIEDRFAVRIPLSSLGLDEIRSVASLTRLIENTCAMEA